MSEAENGARLEPRTNLFVMATISAPGMAGPVRVRNLSPGGALIEGSALPAAKERVQLRRGRLSVTGEVVWSASGQAGLRFLSRLRVENWLPTSANRVAQQQLDELLHEVRTDPNRCAPSPAAAKSDPADAFELARLAKALEDLANDLADDPAAVSRYACKLQTLDMAAQVLWNLSAGRP